MKKISPFFKGNVNGGIKNNGDFAVSGKISVVGEVFDPRGLIKAGLGIETGVEPIAIPEINIKDYLAKANYVFKPDGSIELYENGNLIEIITGGKWKDPSGAQWKYDPDNNSWGVIGGKPSSLKGNLYFETNFKNPAKSVIVEGQVVVEGFIKDSGKLTVKAGTAYYDALVVGQGAFFTDDIDIFGKIYIGGDTNLTSKAKVHSGGIIIKGSLELTNHVSIYYVGLVKQKAEEIAKLDYENAEFTFSQLFNDINGNSALEVALFKKSGDVPEISSLEELISAIESGTLIENQYFTEIVGASLDYSPEQIFYNGFPRFIKQFIEIKNNLISQGYTTIELKNLTTTSPMEFWGDIYADGKYKGTYSLSTSQRFVFNQQERDWYFGKVREVIEAYKSTDEYLEGQEIRLEEWQYYEGMEIPYSKCKSTWNYNSIPPVVRTETVDHDFQIGTVYAFSWTRGCTPTATAMLLDFWRRQGYGRLIDYKEDGTQETCRDLIWALADEMGTADIFPQATFPWNVISGLTQVTNSPSRGNGYNFSGGRYAGIDTTMKDQWEAMVEQINNGRPGLLNWYKPFAWDFHTVVVVGWEKKEYNHWYCGKSKRYLYYQDMVGEMPGYTSCTSTSQGVDRIHFDWWAHFGDEYDVFKIIPGGYYNYSLISLDKLTPGNEFCPGNIVNYKLIIQNTGDTTWYNWGTKSIMLPATVRFTAMGYEFPFNHPGPLWSLGWESPGSFNYGGICHSIEWFIWGCVTDPWGLIGVNCGANRIVRHQETMVRPGETATFVFNVTAPPITMTDYFKFVSTDTQWVCGGPIISITPTINLSCDCVEEWNEINMNCVCNTNPVACDFCKTYPDYCITCPSIVTLAGTSLEPEIGTLRKFRDTVLEPTDPGKFLRELYYKYGAEISKAAQQNEDIKRRYRDLITYALPEIKSYILDALNGENHLFERQLNQNEVQMLKDFIIALYSYASDDFKIWLTKAYYVLVPDKTLSEIITALRN